MNWLDTKYIRLLSGRLERFKQKGDVFNFKCPICGDSEKKNKTRGYLLSQNNKTNFYCHNCNTTMALPKFIKLLDNSLYAEYIKEVIFGDRAFPLDPIETKEAKREVDLSLFKKLKKISQLDSKHPAKQYVENRKIPSRFHYKLFFCEQFQTFTNTIIPNKFPNIIKDEPRLILAMMDSEKNIFGYQGRSFKKKTDLRYITIMLDETKPKFFGLESINLDRNIFVFEGAIDSMMLSNSIASCDGSITNNCKNLDIDKEKFTAVYDNEPRNFHIVENMIKSVKDGYKVCVWPSNIKEKDVNEMVMAGMSPLDIRSIINDNTFVDLEATLKIAEWRKS